MVIHKRYTMAKKQKTKSMEALRTRFVTHFGVRNTSLETLHAGTSPSSKTGDYSDVKVVTPYGEIPWKNVSRISDTELRALMLDIEKKVDKALKAFERVQTEFDSPQAFKAFMTDHLFTVGVSWDLNFEEIERRINNSSSDTQNDPS